MKIAEGFAEKKIKLGRIGINYVEAGKGKPIVMIHGWTNNWIGMVPLANFLKDKYRVIIIDLPGYGDSDRLKKYNCSIEARYVKSFVDRLKLKEMSLLGHSMGTFVVAKFVKKYPRRADRIIMIGAVLRKEGRQLLAMLMQHFFELVSKKGFLETVVKKTVDIKTYSYLTAKYINMYKFDKKIIDVYGLIGKKKMDKKAYSQMGAEIAKTDVAKLVKGNRKPMLFVYGKHDKICNLRQAREILAGKGKYKFAEIEEAGHIVPVEKPAEVARVVEKFVG
jgi:pimeloyl-ACP methyl ester carboxylesterase